METLIGTSFRFFEDIRHLPLNRAGRNVEFALHPQHETACDSEIQTKEDFNSKFRKTTWKFGANVIEQHKKRSIRISMLKVASPNGLNSRRVKLEQSSI